MVVVLLMSTFHLSANVKAFAHFEGVDLFEQPAVQHLKLN